MTQYTTQQQLAADNLDLVKWVILDHINVNENACGFGWDDLFQEGYVHLCRAARSYDGSGAKFPTYARAVIRNGLLDHCRRTYRRNKRLVSLNDAEILTAADLDENSVKEAVELLEAFKPEFSGSALRGLEALQLRIRGDSVTEIAAMYGVKPNLVGAWLSRAAAKLRSNRRFLATVGHANKKSES